MRTRLATHCRILACVLVWDSSDFTIVVLFPFPYVPRVPVQSRLEANRLIYLWTTSHTCRQLKWPSVFILEFIHEVSLIHGL